MTTFDDFFAQYKLQVARLTASKEVSWPTTREQLLLDIPPGYIPTYLHNISRIVQTLMKKGGDLNNPKHNEELFIPLMQDMVIAMHQSYATPGKSLRVLPQNFDQLCTWRLTPQGADFWSNLNFHFF